MQKPNNSAGETSVKSFWAGKFGLAATRSLQILIIGTLGVIILKALLSVQLVMLPAIIALILASSLWPFTRLLRHRFSAMASAWMVLGSAALVLGGIATLLFFTIQAQADELANKASDGFGQLREMAQNHFPGILDQEQIDKLIEGAKEFFTSGQFGAGAISGLSAAGNFFAGLTLTFVILFFFLKDGDKMWHFALSWLPENVSKRKWEKSGVQTIMTLGDYIRGTAIVAAVDAVGIGAGLAILQVPLAMPLALIVFLGGFIPMVGATAAGILAALVALVANGIWAAVIVVAVVVVVNQLEGNFLQPVVMSRALNLHGLVILISLTAGTVLGGLTGAVLSVPLAATGWAVLKIWTGRQTLDDDERLMKTMAAERASKDPNAVTRTSRRKKREKERAASENNGNSSKDQDSLVSQES